ncbi:hypothetical protein DMN77_16165 [Paenibacillus sp. 79R4]|nr:hypothetical protein [Paenibacillus sp. 79R4]
MRLPEMRRTISFPASAALLISLILVSPKLRRLNDKPIKKLEKTENLIDNDYYYQLDKERRI